VTSTNSGNETGGGEPLTGDGVTPGIVRIGATVRRPVRPFTRTVQAYLAHLHEAGFTAAPVPLGTDDHGREVLSFVPGDVPREPLPAETAGDDVLTALARLIRALHAASAGWTPPPDAVWGGIPGTEFLPVLIRQRDHAQEHGQPERATLFKGLIDGIDQPPA
jgi:phosphotransferase family enzyme